MRCNEFGECRQMMCLLARILNRGPRDRLPRNTSGEQPFLWPRRLPVAAQYIQQLGRQHHVSVFTALCVRRIYVAMMAERQSGSVASTFDGNITFCIRIVGVSLGSR